MQGGCGAEDGVGRAQVRCPWCEDLPAAAEHPAVGAPGAAPRGRSWRARPQPEPSSPGAPRRPGHRVPDPRPPLGAPPPAACLQALVPPPRRQLLLLPAQDPRHHRRVDLRYQARPRRPHLLGGLRSGVGALAAAATRAGRVLRGAGVRLRGAQRLSPVLVRRQGPAAGVHAPGGVLQRQDQQVASGAGHAAPPPLLRVLRDGQPAVRGGRGERGRGQPVASVGGGVRPEQEPVVLGGGDEHGDGALHRRRVQRSVVPQGAGASPAGAQRGLPAGCGCLVPRGGGDGQRLEEPDGVRWGKAVRAGLQGRVQAEGVRRGGGRMEKGRGQRGAPRGVEGAGGGSTGAARGEALCGQE